MSVYTSHGQKSSRPLHSAITSSNAFRLKHLLRSGHHDVNGKDCMGRTPIMLACQATLSRQIMAKMLLLHNPDLCLADECGQTAVYLAVHNNDTELLKVFL